jgi:hypothetical protein
MRNSSLHKFFGSPWHVRIALSAYEQPVSRNMGTRYTKYQNPFFNYFTRNREI